MAIEINLLPWRKTRFRREKQKFINLVLAGLTMIILSCLLINYCVFKLVEKHQNDNYYLRKEITILNKKIHEIAKTKEQKNRLIKRILALQKLQSRLILVNHLFNELITLMPEDVYLNSLGGNKNQITLEGYSESNLSLSKLMKKIEQNPWMKSANLVQIKKEKPFNSINHFTLNFILKSDNKEKKLI